MFKEKNKNRSKIGFVQLTPDHASLDKQLSESVVMLQIFVALKSSFLASHIAIPSTLHDLDFLTTNILDKKIRWCH